MLATCAPRRSPPQITMPSREMHERSRDLFERSQRLIPGGVNSPVRAFRAVGGTPVFLREGRGARVIDEDGREYIDYAGSRGPLTLGAAHSRLVAAIRTAAGRGPCT